MIFVDTGPLVAVYRSRDQFHQQALAIFPSLPLPFLTSNHVLDEVATLLGGRAGFRFAADRMADMLASPSVNIMESTRADETRAIDWMRKYADHGISFTDCTSFAIMQRLGVGTAFTFDRHFEIAGFEVFPGGRALGGR